MPSLWLPLGRPRYAQPRDEREELMNRLWELRVLIPGAASMEIQELRDYVQWQEARALDDARKALYRPAHQPKKLSREQVIIGLKEYRDYRTARDEGRRRLYLGGGASDGGE